MFPGRGGFPLAIIQHCIEEVVYRAEPFNSAADRNEEAGEHGRAYIRCGLPTINAVCRAGRTILLLNWTLIEPVETGAELTLLSTPFPKCVRGFQLVTPAQAGVQKSWIPAHGGMTIEV